MSEEHMTQQAELSPEYVTFEDFTKVDIRAGVITAAERIPKADRLLKLNVDLGELGHRTIAAGIAESYTPEAVVGRHVLVVVNFAPRKLKGVESHGMILAGRRVPDNVIELASCPMVAPGTKIT